MANNLFLLRQLHIYRKMKRENARNHYPSLIELKDYVEMEMEKDLRKSQFSEVTLKRDLQQLRSQFKIPIVFDKSRNGYYIDENAHNSFVETALTSFDILSSINADGRFPDYIIPEDRKSDGVEHFYYLARCIEDQKYVNFDYFKYDSNQTEEKTIAPSALKQSRHRWYLLGIEEGETQVKAYGLDRIILPEKTDKKMNKKVSLQEINDLYKDCFAMFTTESPAEDILLSFDKRDGNYIKSFPIHHSQKLEEKEERILVSLHAKITLDLMMELMSRSWSIEIVQPLSLRENFQKIYTSALLRNS